MKLLGRVQLFATPGTIAYQAPLSMKFSRQEYWNGLPFPSPGDLPYPGIEPGSPTLQADCLSTTVYCLRSKVNLIQSEVLTKKEEEGQEETKLKWR